MKNQQIQIRLTVTSNLIRVFSFIIAVCTLWAYYPTVNPPLTYYLITSIMLSLAILAYLLWRSSELSKQINNCK